MWALGQQGRLCRQGRKGSKHEITILATSRVHGTPRGAFNRISSAVICRQVGGGAIYLCGRADGAPDRHFTGSVTHLALYNEALTPLQIRMIFAQARRPRLSS